MYTKVTIQITRTAFDAPSERTTIARDRSKLQAQLAQHVCLELRQEQERDKPTV